jgi:hypothetical protein
MGYSMAPELIMGFNSQINLPILIENIVCVSDGKLKLRNP